MVLSENPKVEIVQADCMDYMKNIPDKYFDLAIVDPPYGLGVRGDLIKRRRLNPSYKGRITYGETVDRTKYKEKDWDKKPEPEYFTELFRISKNQIIWGGNHFQLPSSKGWIFWDKLMPIEVNFSAGELAWTSFNTKIRKFTYQWAGFAKQVKTDRIHPTEKPVALYDWLLYTFAKTGDKIIDTHLGSGSSAISAFKYKHDFVGIEIDDEYFSLVIKRVKKYITNFHEPLFGLEHKLKS